MFTAETVAQIAAFFTHKEGGASKLLKLIKLMYLSDRESMRRHGYPISFDNFVSMEHGPVLSRTLNLISNNKHASDAEIEI